MRELLLYYYLADDDDDAKRRWRTNLLRLNINKHDCTAIMYMYSALFSIIAIVSLVCMKKTSFFSIFAPRGVSLATHQRGRSFVFALLSRVYFLLFYMIATIQLYYFSTPSSSLLLASF